MDLVNLHHIFGPDGDFPEFTPEEEEALMTPTSESDAWLIVGDMVYMTAETKAVLEERAKEWRVLYPYGEPHEKKTWPPSEFHTYT